MRKGQRDREWVQEGACNLLSLNYYLMTFNVLGVKSFRLYKLTKLSPTGIQSKML